MPCFSFIVYYREGALGEAQAATRRQVRIWQLGLEKSLVLGEVGNVAI